ncbi:DNA adenine methylase [Desulfolithobacter sp.]
MSQLIPYFGGKTRLAKQIIERIPEHTCYVEVFAGSATVLFKKEPSKSEVINDLDRELITLYRVLKEHPEEFHRQFKYCLTARNEFDRLLKVDPSTLTDVQRAARYFYLQKNSFGGKVTGRTFGTSTTDNPRFNLFRLEQTITESWQRLWTVTIEALDFRQLIPKYDRPHTFFFLDPPYWELPGYNHDFEAQDFVDLAEILRGLKGKFLMTINDTPAVRKIFNEFNFEEVKLRYSMARQSNSRAQKRTELFVTNYPVSHK